MNKISFTFKDITADLIKTVNGVILPTEVTVQVWIQSNTLGTWWIELSNMGYPVLCTNIPIYTDCPIVAIDNVPSEYTILPVAFIGGRPDDKIRK